MVLAKGEGAEEGHEDGLGEGALLGAITEGVFATNDAVANLAFGVVVIGRDLGVIEEGQQGILVAAEAFGQTVNMLVGGGGSGQGLQTCLKAGFSSSQDFCGERSSLASQGEGVLEEAFEGVAEA